MFEFVKRHLTHKVIVRALCVIAFINLTGLIVYINVNSITLYRQFLKFDLLISNRLHANNITNHIFVSLNVSFTTAAKQKTYISSNTQVTSVPKIDTIDRPLICDRCFDVKFEYLINNEHICIPNQQSVKILLLITSSPQNELARKTIRETWLTHTNHNKGQVRYVFLLGTSQNNEKIYTENAITKDIILADFQDAYSNLTLKTLMGFQWAINFCKTAQFIMKTDDDMYVNIPGLIIRITENIEPLQSAVGGSCAVTASPIRDKHSKWYASSNSYPQDTYPGFCSGTGYVTSMNVVSKVIQTSKNIPFFHLEDVYVSLCIKKLGYRLLPLKGFVDRPPLDPCRYKNNNLVTAHQVPLEWMHQIYDKPCLNH